MRNKSTSVSMRVRIGDNELEVTGPESFVESKINEFVKGQKERSERIPSAHRASPDAGSAIAGVSGKKMSIAQFFKSASPKSDVDRTLVAGYYLEKYENAESFTAAEIRETIRKAKINPPKNTSDTIARNIRKGLMMSAGDKEGKMAFVLTTDGEDGVGQAVKTSSRG